MLQMEKNSRTRLEVMKEHKKQRMEELKGLIVKDRELCDIMCTTPFCIDKESIPSLKQLETYHVYLDNLTKEKVPPAISILNYDLPWVGTYIVVTVSRGVVMMNL